MSAGTKKGSLSDLPEVQLKYPDLDAFARASRKTFKIGRMTLKSKKVFKAESRLLLKFVISDLEEPVKVIGEIIDVVPPKEGPSATYGIRFLNFTEKKLKKLIKAQSEPGPPAEDEKPREEIKPAEPEAAPPAPEPSSEQPLPPVPEEEPGEETDVYTIEVGDGEEHMSFEERPEEFEPPSHEQPPPSEPKETLEQAGEEEEFDIGGEELAEPEGSLAEAGESLALEEEREGLEGPSPAPEEKEKAAAEMESEQEEAPLPSEGFEEEPEPLPSLEDERSAEPEPSLPEEVEAAGAEEPVPSEPAVSQETAEMSAETGLMESEAIETPELGEISEPRAEIPVPKSVPAAEPEVEKERPKEPVVKPMSPAEYQMLCDFLMKLSRSLLQPPPAETKEAQRGLKSLYEDFKTIMQDRDELGMFMRTSSTGKDFVLEGTDVEPKSIKAVFPRGASADLVIKLADLFERKGLLGLTLRKYSTEDAFQAFVNLLSAFSGKSEDIDALVRSLVQSGAYHLTPIFLRDQISETEGINWRVAMTLSRLSGEMRRLILVADAIDEDPRALFTLRVEDALKPVQKPEMLADLLLSCRHALAGQSEFNEADLQSEVVFALSLDKLVAACELMAQQFEDVFTALRKSPDDMKLKAREEAIRKTLRRAMARVSYEAPDSGMKILRHLYSQGVLSYDEMPEVLRGRIDAEQAAEDFQNDPRRELEDFEKKVKARDYERRARQMAYLVIELLRRDKTDLADLAFNVLANHRTQKTPPFPERPRLAREAMQVFADKDSIPVILDKFSSGSKDARALAASLFYAGGEAVTGVLLGLLAESEERTVRRMVCDILVRLGDKVAPKLHERLLKPDTPWYLARNLVMVLAEMTSPVLMDDLDKFVTHEHPRVREEALGYLLKLSKAKGGPGEDPEPKLVRALHDPDLQVRRKTVQLLGQLKELSDFSMQGLVWLMEKKSEAEPSKEEELLFIQVAELLGKAANRRLPEGRTVEDALVKILESESKGLFGRMVRSKGRTSRMLASLIETLGKIGTEKSRKLITQFSKDKDPAVKKSAQTAIARLNK
jgi:HEAT repeat protein